MKTVKSGAQKFGSRAVLALTFHVKAVLTPVAFGVSALVEDEDSRVLLVRHSYARGWQLPSGGVAQREAPAHAVLRELKEEVGLQSSEPPELFGLYTRRVLWTNNAIALYRVRAARIAFRPNLEIREAMFVDPKCPPDGTTAATLRRLLELTGQEPPSVFW